MRDDLAGRLLDKLLDWTDEEQRIWVADLATMADYKFDDYEGFSAGERFFERLARWLAQFPDPLDRRRLIEFVRSELVFISRNEMNQAISCVYPHYIKPRLVERAAKEINVHHYRRREVVSSTAFKALRRKTVFLGLSDGARLDQLRRSSTELSHEQFSLTAELGDHTRQSMVEKLQKALDKISTRCHDPLFETVVLVDDFYGSGTSLIDQRDDGTWKGKLYRANKHIEKLISLDTPIICQDPMVVVVLYVASGQAKAHIDKMLEKFQPTWKFVVVQEFPEGSKIVDSELLRICDDYFDPIMIDEYKGPAPIGYMDAALPVVLFHNTPNNSISPLWADTEFESESLKRRALFPRYERHHVDRP